MLPEAGETQGKFVLLVKLLNQIQNMCFDQLFNA